MRKRLPRTITTLASLPFITPMLSTSSWQVLKWATVVWMMVLGGGNSEVRNKSLELYTNTVTFSPAGPFCVGDIISYSVSGVPSTMYQIDVYS
ncbi:MAG TPA: hypothetical protein PK643_18025, partial [Saprospiraceae bacterium]|nr:hypothetical protein [Saprospiraceae bacterium]